MNIQPFSYMRRTIRTLVLLALFAVAFTFRRARSSSAGPQILRRYLEAAGGAFIKVGQFLAMRYDLLPIEYCSELSRLLDQLPPSRSTDIVQTVEHDLGKRIDECFLTFDVVPLSSASVAQVHAATLLDGRKVVVKVRHPEIESRYRIDLLNFKLLAQFSGLLGLLGRMNVRQLSREFEQLAEEELDFRHEARNIYILHELLEKDEADHRAPEVHLELCGASVITMERFEGVWVSEILSAIDSNDTERLNAWAGRGITASRTARLLLYSMLEQSLTHRIFHADPHAGNLIVMEGGTLGYVDFGMVGWLDEKMWEKQFILNKSIANNRMHRAYEALLDTMEPLPPRNLRMFEFEVKRLMVNWFVATKVPRSPIRQRSASSFFLNVLDVIRREQLNVSLTSVRLVRALVISDAIALRLDPSLSRVAELRAYFNEQRRRQLEDELAEHGPVATLYGAAIEVIRSFQLVPEVLDWLRSRLPQLARQYNSQLSSFEQTGLVVFRYLRIFVWLTSLAIIGSRLIAWRFFPASTWARLWPAVRPNWWVAAGGCILVAIMLGSILKRFR